jgi:hypothetical protein
MGVAGRFKNCLQGILGSTAILPEIFEKPIWQSMLS